MSDSPTKALTLATGGLLAFALVLTPALAAIGPDGGAPAKEVGLVSEPFEAKAGTAPAKPAGSTVQAPAKKGSTATIDQASKAAVEAGTDAKKKAPKEGKTKDAAPPVQPERKSPAKALKHSSDR